MKLNIKELPAKIAPIVQKLRQYAGFVAVLVALGAFGFLIFEIRRLVISEPSEASINEKLEGLQRPKIDQATIDKIQQLESANVEVHTLFQQARDNPFQE